MIEVQINPEDHAGSVLPFNQFVKTKLAQAGIPVIIDAKQSLAFSEPGTIHVDFGHLVTVYQWVPGVDSQSLVFEESTPIKREQSFGLPCADQDWTAGVFG